MSILVAVDGRVAARESEAVVPVLDRGFLYGDSVYEVVRTYGERPFALEAHLERLMRSAALLEMEVPWTVEELAAEVEGLLSRVDAARDKGIRVILTRGSGDLGLDPGLADRPRRVMIVFDPPVITAQQRRDGVGVVLVAAGRCAGGAVPGGAKTGNYLTNVMALGRARERDAFEAILVDTRGHLAEGTTSNLFVVSGGALRTPPLAVGILDGITRRHVIALAGRAGIEIVEEELLPEDLRGADEAFLTSTLKEILPVTRVDDERIGDGCPGPVTDRIFGLYRALTAGRAS